MTRPENFYQLRQSIEQSLVADPQDLAAHAALADLLLESEDPALAARGEFIQVQLALEQAGLAEQERLRLEAREEELHQHQRDWLGPLAPFLLDSQGLTMIARSLYGFLALAEEWRFAHGWLDMLHINDLTLLLARTLRRAPEARLLRQLIIEKVEEDNSCEVERLPEDNIPQHEFSVGLCPLVGAETLCNLRCFQLGSIATDDYRSFNCDIHSSVVPALVSGMPKLEELSLYANRFDLSALFALPLPRLRVLRVYHVDRVYRLGILANNPTMGNLEHLSLHPHHLAWWRNTEDDEQAGYNAEEGYIPLSVVRPLLYSPNLPQLRHLALRVSSMGDEGCKEIVRSGILERLHTLDLRHGRITDRGARMLAECPAIRRLQWLDLDRNSLTAEGIALIKGLGIAVRVEDQHDPVSVEAIAEFGEDAFAMDEEDEYLSEGEFE
jgi:uncharacterized protein (TIGR02996 family)